MLVGSAFEMGFDRLELLDDASLLVAAFALLLLNFLAAGLDLLDVIRRRLNRQVFGEQIIAGVAGRDFNNVAYAADVLDRFFERSFTFAMETSVGSKLWV